MNKDYDTLQHWATMAVQKYIENSEPPKNACQILKYYSPCDLYSNCLSTFINYIRKDRQQLERELDIMTDEESAEYILKMYDFVMRNCN